MTATSTSSRPPTRAKSASTLSRPLTAPLHHFRENFFDRDETESDDEFVPISTNPTPSASLEKPSDEGEETRCRITWPVRIRVFALQDENETRKQYLAWKAEQRKTKIRRSSKTFFDEDLEKQYQQSIRRRQELEAFLTPELIAEHKQNDPIFAKRYRQLQLAIRAGKLPNYDPHDCEIHPTTNKLRIQRARSALINAKQTKIQTFYRQRQNLNDNQLTKRVETFLKKLDEFKKENL